MNPELAARQFKALADPTRLRILAFLRECGQRVMLECDGTCRIASGPAVGEVCCQFEQAPSTVSHHLKELRTAGLIQMQRSGKHVYCAVNEEAVMALARFLSGPPESSPEALEER